MRVLKVSLLVFSLFAQSALGLERQERRRRSDNESISEKLELNNNENELSSKKIDLDDGLNFEDEKQDDEASKEEGFLLFSYSAKAIGYAGLTAGMGLLVTGTSCWLGKRWGEKRSDQLRNNFENGLEEGIKTEQEKNSEILLKLGTSVFSEEEMKNVQSSDYNNLVIFFQNNISARIEKLKQVKEGHEEVKKEKLEKLREDSQNLGSLQEEKIENTRKLLGFAKELFSKEKIEEENFPENNLNELVRFFQENISAKIEELKKYNKKGYKEVKSEYLKELEDAKSNLSIFREKLKSIVGTQLVENYTLEDVASLISGIQVYHQQKDNERKKLVTQKDFDDLQLMVDSLNANSAAGSVAESSEESTKGIIDVSDSSSPEGVAISNSSLSSDLEEHEEEFPYHNNDISEEEKRLLQKNPVKIEDKGSPGSIEQDDKRGMFRSSGINVPSVAGAGGDAALTVLDLTTSEVATHQISEFPEDSVVHSD